VLSFTKLYEGKIFEGICEGFLNSDKNEGNWNFPITANLKGASLSHRSYKRILFKNAKEFCTGYGLEFGTT